MHAPRHTDNLEKTDNVTEDCRKASKSMAKEVGRNVSVMEHTTCFTYSLRHVLTRTTLFVFTDHFPGMQHESYQCNLPWNVLAA